MIQEKLQKIPLYVLNSVIASVGVFFSSMLSNALLFLFINNYVAPYLKEYDLPKTINKTWDEIYNSMFNDAFREYEPFINEKGRDVLKVNLNKLLKSSVAIVPSLLLPNNSFPNHLIKYFLFHSFFIRGAHEDPLINLKTDDHNQYFDKANYIIRLMYCLGIQGFLDYSSNGSTSHSQVDKSIKVIGFLFKSLLVTDMINNILFKDSQSLENHQKQLIEQNYKTFVPIYFLATQTVLDIELDYLRQIDHFQQNYDKITKSCMDFTLYRNNPTINLVEIIHKNKANKELQQQTEELLKRGNDFFDSYCPSRNIWSCSEKLSKLSEMSDWQELSKELMENCDDIHALLTA